MNGDLYDISLEPLVMNNIKEGNYSFVKFLNKDTNKDFILKILEKILLQLISF